MSSCQHYIRIEIQIMFDETVFNLKQIYMKKTQLFGAKTIKFRVLLLHVEHYIQYVESISMRPR